jgi:hypothetical protein
MPKRKVLDMTTSNTGRADIACNALLYLTIGLGTLSFWCKAVPSGDPLDYVAAIVLTVAMFALSYVLSGVVMRFAEAKDKGAPLTASLVVVFGIVLGLIEIAMTHSGLAWLNARSDLSTDEALWLASSGLTGMNVFGIYVFARTIPSKPEASAPASKSADAAVFSPPVVVAEPTASDAGRALAMKRHHAA